MNTALHTFMDIFTADFAIDEDANVRLRKIVIPIIQRDYAQGRTDADIQRVRKNIMMEPSSVIGKRLFFSLSYKNQFRIRLP